MKILSNIFFFLVGITLGSEVLLSDGSNDYFNCLLRRCPHPRDPNCHSGCPEGFRCYRGYCFRLPNNCKEKCLDGYVCENLQCVPQKDNLQSIFQ
jgi:hypothetical protein